MGWRIITAGTNKTLSTAVTINVATSATDRVFTVDTVSNIVEGNYIGVSGEAPVYKVLHVDAVNKKIYLDQALTGDRNASSVTFAGITFLALPNN